MRTALGAQSPALAVLFLFLKDNMSLSIRCRLITNKVVGMEVECRNGRKMCSIRWEQGLKNTVATRFVCYTRAAFLTIAPVCVVQDRKGL